MVRSSQASAGVVSPLGVSRKDSFPGCAETEYVHCPVDPFLGVGSMPAMVDEGTRVRTRVARNVLKSTFERKTWIAFRQSILGRYMGQIVELGGDPEDLFLGSGIKKSEVSDLKARGVDLPAANEEVCTVRLRSGEREFIFDLLVGGKFPRAQQIAKIDSQFQVGKVTFSHTPVPEETSRIDPFAVTQFIL